MESLHPSATPAPRTWRIRWGIAGGLLLAILLLWGITGPGYRRPAPTPALLAAEQRWQTQRVQDYTLSIALDAASEPRLGGVLDLTVQRNQVVASECRSQTGACGLFWVPGTRDAIALLFALARDGFQDEAGLIEGCLQVTYDPQYGFPQRIDSTACAVPHLDITPRSLTVTAFAVLAPDQLPAKAQGTLPADLLDRWRQVGPCAVPCYEGMTPGHTTASEAYQLLQRHPLVQRVDVDRYPAAHVGTLTWRWVDGNEGGQADFSLDGDERISRIVPTRIAKLTLGDIIARYGAPEQVITTDFCASWGKARFFHLEFYYPALGLYVRGPYKHPRSVEAQLPIEGIALYPAYHPRPHLDYEETKGDTITIVAWNGYQDFFAYSGTKPEFVCP